MLATTCLALTSCGDDSSNKSDDDPTNTESSGATDPGKMDSDSANSGKTKRAAREVVESYEETFYSGDFTATCALLTPAYQKATIKDAEEFSDKPPEDCEAAMKIGAEFAKSFGYDPTSAKITEIKIKGDRATVLELNEEPFEDTLYSLTWDGSQWLVADDKSVTIN
ncbi:hypothetical protein ASH02_19520 [Nocardioides sp. Soil796]|nr:hypothetical protein ASH02_19520 [Nocardioides sp. Soil796]